MDQTEGVGDSERIEASYEVYELAPTLGAGLKGGSEETEQTSLSSVSLSLSRGLGNVWETMTRWTVDGIEEMKNNRDEIKSSAKCNNPL